MQDAYAPDEPLVMEAPGVAGTHQPRDETQTRLGAVGAGCPVDASLFSDVSLSLSLSVSLSASLRGGTSAPRPLPTSNAMHAIRSVSYYYPIRLVQEHRLG